MKIKLFIIFIVFGGFLSTIFAADTSPINKAASNTAITIANQYPDYPATPGDVYDIYFLTGGNINQTLRGFVDGDYNIDLSFIGIVNVKGLIYSEIQRVLKDKILSAYPGSIVNVIISVPGKFRVTLLGEVNNAEIIDSMSLTTLAQIISGKTTEYASFRDIEIKSDDGSVAVYDLYQFTRYADKKHNPFLKPNDVITIKPYKRTVIVTGEVKRPGTYQLLENDTLNDLVHIYADNFNKIAEISRIEIQRVLDNSGNVYQQKTFYIDGTDEDLNSIKLSDFDQVNILSKSVFTSKVYIQGAISFKPLNASGSNSTQVGVTVSNKLPVPIIEGNRVSTVLSKMDGTFNLSSSLEEAFILRGNERLNVNLVEVMSSVDSKDDIVMMDKDILIVPFKQHLVYVSGSVNSSGTIPFIENRTALYYIGLAGGFNRTENLFGSYSVRNVYGEKLKNDAIIGPEDIIWVNRDHPLSYVVEYSGWITTILTAITLSISVASLSS